MPYPRMHVNIPSAPSSGFRPVARAAHDGFSAAKPQELNVSPSLQELNKENQGVDGAVVQPRKSAEEVEEALKFVKKFENQVRPGLEALLVSE